MNQIREATIAQNLGDIRDLAAEGIDLLGGDFVTKSKLEEARDSSIFYSHTVIQRSIFISCVDGLHEESYLEMRDISSSKHFTILITSLKHWFYVPLTFEEKADEINKHFAKNYFRENWRKFLEKLTEETSKILTDDNIGRNSCRFSFCEETKKWRGGIFRNVAVSLDDLSKKMLTIEELEAKILFSVCSNIIHCLNTSNRNLQESVTQPSHCEPFSRFFSSENCNVFHLMSHFVSDFKCDEELKRSELISFWQEVSQIIITGNEREENLFFFPNDYSNILFTISVMAKNYFQGFNENIVNWNILENIDSKYSQGQLSANHCVHRKSFDACVKDFQTLVHLETSVELLRRYEWKITDLINLFKEFATLWSSSNSGSGIRSTLMLFYDDFSILLQNFLTDGQTDTSPTIKFYQRVRDVSAHMVQYFLETEIYPQPKVCLAFIRLNLLFVDFNYGLAPQLKQNGHYYKNFKMN